jgi:hypothetical protein
MVSAGKSLVFDNEYILYGITVRLSGKIPVEENPFLMMCSGKAFSVTNF